ncbi:MAG: hypothetical protein ACUVRD_08960 [Bacteroidia bacterium]
MSFFAHYYEDGDFVPQPRLCMRGYAPYAISYHGQEIKFHWEYYVKTGLLFWDYAFRAEDWCVAKCCTR